ncbi:MAG: Holliday junction resolvase RuvX [Candidatus Villigracilaceae bacterium]
MKILAVDPGEKRLGLAVSDPTGTLARPLGVLKHVSRLADAARVAEVAHENGAELILVGQSFDESGQPNLAGRQAANFAAALRTQTVLPVVLWDEAFTTRDARAARLAAGAARKKRMGHLDDWAAVVLLQSYLDSLQT